MQLDSVRTIRSQSEQSMAKLTPKRIKELEHELERIDAELDAIIRDYYQTPGAQNVGGNIGQLSRMHADLVEQLAKEKILCCR